MTLKTYTAIYENGQIVWETADRPTEHRARVLVTVVESLDSGDDDEHASWRLASLNNLARAYGTDEPNYTIEDIRFR